MASGRKRREGARQTFIVIVPTRFCAVPAELELAFVDPVDFADDTVWEGKISMGLSWGKGVRTSWCDWLYDEEGGR